MYISKIMYIFVASKPDTEVNGLNRKAGMHIYGKAFTKRLFFGYTELRKL